MVHEEYTGTYEKAAVSEETSDQTSPVQVCAMTSCASSNSFNLIQGNEGISIFANISVGTSAATTLSEVDEYLNRPVENILDPLKWWIDNRRVYPNLSSMALDYLSVPRKSFNTISPCSLITSPSNVNCSRTRLFSRPAHFTLHSEPSITLSYSRLPLPWLLGTPWHRVHQ